MEGLAAFETDEIGPLHDSKSPKSLTEIYRLLGGQKLSGSVAAEMRTLVPGIDEQVGKNKAAGTSKEEGAPKSEPALKVTKKSSKAPKSSAPRSEETASTPYRNGSAYSMVYQILMEHPDGISRADLIREAARRCKKPANRSAFDVAVVVSPRESCTGPRHRSARDKYYIEVEGSCLKLRTS